MATVPNMGVLQVVSEKALQQHEATQDAARVATENAVKAQYESTPQMSRLAAYIRGQFEVMRNHRDNVQAGWSERLLKALRAFNGQYEADKLAQIRAFGGSEIYARVIAMKCRGASSLLRDVYLAPDRPWGLDPPADPDVPPEMVQNIQTLVQGELASNMQLGGPGIDVDAVRDRVTNLMELARIAAKKKAGKQAQIAEDKIDELLTQGNFYKALAEIIVDVPLFPYCVMKGPVVRIVPSVRWDMGRAVTANVPRMFWNRVSPFDVWWTPGVSDIEDAAIIERMRYTRADLNDLLDLPGYNTEAVRCVLKDYGCGALSENWDMTEPERAVLENREDPMTNRSGLLSCLEFHGNVQGEDLLEFMDEGAAAGIDPVRDYHVQAWLIDRYIIKVQLTPSPRKRHPYFVTSFEKVPGTPVGNGLPDILSDVADVCNSALRTLVNNLSISSGPQVVINTDRMANGADAENLYPWKRWHTTSDPLGNNSQQPISFFQPNSNAQELLAVYGRFNDLADELSAIPKYLSGGTAGGAGRTAAGLAMLMGNASKILQTVAANIDRDIMDPALTGLFDMLMLTDTSGLLTGQEQVKVMGVNVAVQRETQRARQLELLTATANPIDAQIMGPKGRSNLLRSVANTVGLQGEEIVPSEEEMEKAQEAHAAQPTGNLAQAGAEAEGQQTGDVATKDMGPRVLPKVSGGVG